MSSLYYFTPAPDETSTWRRPDAESTWRAGFGGALIQMAWTGRPMEAILLSELSLPVFLEAPLAYEQTARAGSETSRAGTGSGLSRSRPPLGELLLGAAAVRARRGAHGRRERQLQADAAGGLGREFGAHGARRRIRQHDRAGRLEAVSSRGVEHGITVGVRLRGLDAREAVGVDAVHRHGHVGEDRSIVRGAEVLVAPHLGAARRARKTDGRHRGCRRRIEDCNSANIDAGNDDLEDDEVGGNETCWWIDVD
jgi:hypothetical protein